MKQSSLNTGGVLRQGIGAILSVIVIAAVLQSCGTSQTANTAPSWAPAYSDGAYAPYYYFPDYGMYYDANAQQYYYLNNGAWASSQAVPYDVDLDHSYTVLLDRNASKPWLNHDYYARNYPPHAHESYGEIARRNQAIPNVPPEHEIAPRAYNENNDRLLFEERARAQAAQQAAPGQPAPRPAPGSRVAVHEVPMKVIAPSMPPESHNYKYGGAAKGR